jgi:hypothetical protein
MVEQEIGILEKLSSKQQQKKWRMSEEGLLPKLTFERAGSKSLA